MLQIYILWDEKALRTSSCINQWSGISCNCALRCERVWSTSFPSDAEVWPSWLSTMWKAWDSVSDWNAADSACDLIANLKKESMTYFVWSRGHTVLKVNHHYLLKSERRYKIQWRLPTFCVLQLELGFLSPTSMVVWWQQCTSVLNNLNNPVCPKQTCRLCCLILT